MKSIKTLFATSTLFTAMFYAPAATIIAIISILVISDIHRATQSTIPAIQPTAPITRADDSAAWDAIFEEPDPIEQPTEEEYNAMFAKTVSSTMSPKLMSYRELQRAIKQQYTATQRKKLGIKLNAKRELLEQALTGKVTTKY